MWVGRDPKSHLVPPLSDLACDICRDGAAAALLGLTQVISPQREGFLPNTPPQPARSGWAAIPLVPSLSPDEKSLCSSPVGSLGSSKKSELWEVGSSSSEPLEEPSDQACLNHCPASLLGVNYCSLQLRNSILSHILVLFSIHLNGKLFICSNHSRVRIFGMPVTILIAWREVFWRTEVRKNDSTPQVIRRKAQFTIWALLLLMT